MPVLMLWGHLAPHLDAPYSGELATPGAAYTWGQCKSSAFVGLSFLLEVFSPCPLPVVGFKEQGLNCRRLKKVMITTFLSPNGHSDTLAWARNSLSLEDWGCTHIATFKYLG